ncbi:unnamed protein product [Schistosoma mattheei]|uniref:Uncharacterized protein n=1 Tax=Schistosoma mattheei TaxID=31246 RepID=A0A183PQI5_9TREM|nr:unnamed protein product [Schistosoma mattheei]
MCCNKASAIMVSSDLQSNDVVDDPTSKRKSSNTRSGLRYTTTNSLSCRLHFNLHRTSLYVPESCTTVPTARMAEVLFVYRSKEKMMRGDRRGCVKLKNAQVGIDDEDDSTFTITVDHKTFHFQARNSDERQKWLDALQEARDLHTQNYALLNQVSDYI